jgi:hypothetical protein
VVLGNTGAAGEDALINAMNTIGKAVTIVSKAVTIAIGG